MIWGACAQEEHGPAAVDHIVDSAVEEQGEFAEEPPVRADGLGPEARVPGLQAFVDNVEAKLRRGRGDDPKAGKLPEEPCVRRAHRSEQGEVDRAVLQVLAPGGCAVHQVYQGAPPEAP